MNWRAVVLRIFKVPHEPSSPPGSKPVVFRAAPNYFYMKLFIWILGQILILIFPLALTIALFAIEREHGPNADNGVLLGLRLLEIIGWVIFFIRLVYGLATIRLDYELRWYMVSDRALRVREGILVVKEKTIALANIQNISVQQGPLQRLLGISDVEVKTAGGGSPGGRHGKETQLGEPMHVARFRGVANANAIRDMLSEGVRRQKSTGLGDPDDHHTHHDDEGDLRDAVAELLAASRALRA